MEKHLENVEEEKTYKPRILYPMITSFRKESKIKTFSGKQNVRKFVSNRTALEKRLKISLGRRKMISHGNIAFLSMFFHNIDIP